MWPVIQINRISISTFHTVIYINRMSRFRAGFFYYDCTNERQLLFIIKRLRRSKNDKTNYFEVSTEEFEELDNLDNFGLDTNTCSGLSQNNTSTDTSSSDDDGEDEIDINQVVNHRVSQLLQNDQDDIPDEENTEEENPDTEEDSNTFK